MGRKFKKTLTALSITESVILTACSVIETQTLSESAGVQASEETTISATTDDPTETGKVTATFSQESSETADTSDETATESGTQTPSAATTPQETKVTLTDPPQTTKATIITTAATTTQVPTTVETTVETTQATTTRETTTPPTETTPAPTIPPTLPTGGEFDTTYNEWYNIRNTTHTIPGIPANAGPWLIEYNGIYVGDTSKKVFYFTFDGGADTGYANQIMDVLANQGIKATFFVTKPYITNNPDIVRRMVNGGHTVANHTVSHVGLPYLSDDQIREEYSAVEEAFNSTTGSVMPKLIRPPMGAYSERSLYITNLLGYRTVFWSIAYKDYDVENQPTHDEAMAVIQNNYHDGAIILLHIASKTDADTLDEMITYLKAMGYSFDVIV